jgi:hypothetical protein
MVQQPQVDLTQKQLASKDEAKVLGQVMQAFLDNLRADDIKPLMEEAGLESIDPQAWYPQQKFVDIYNKLETMPGGTEDIVAIGVQTVDALEFPDAVQDIPAALQALPQMYDAIHKNAGDDEGWQIDVVSDDEIRVTFNSPYSDYAAYGYLYSIARRFRPQGRSFSLIPTLGRDGQPALFTIRIK